jgi:hypothetical protein
MPIWLSKPFYEAVPYFYLVAGVCAFGASLYLNYWYWPTICLILGFACLIAGLIIWLKRRDFRYNIRTPDDDPDF